MGSPPLQMLLDENWESDIDLYVMDSSHENNKLHLNDLIDELDKFRDDSFVDLSNITSFYTNIYGETVSRFEVNMLSKMGSYLRYSHYRLIQEGSLGGYEYNVDDIRKVDTYTYRCQKEYHCSKRGTCSGCQLIQIIHIDHQKHFTFKSMAESFDLDFCKIIFDGKLFEVLYPDAILKRTSIQKGKDWVCSEFYDQRKKKYQKRGFTVN